VPLNVWVTGSHGFLGSALARALAARGDTATPVGRDGERLRLDGLSSADAVVHLAGAGIGDAKWTEERKRLLVDSRVGPTAQLAATNSRSGADSTMAARAPSQSGTSTNVAPRKGSSAVRA